MRTAPLVALLLLSASTAPSASGGDEVEALRRTLGGRALSASELTPPGFVKAAEARGDLNGDGLDDVALIVHRRPDETRDDQDFPQVVMVFLHKRSGGYSLWKLGGAHFIESTPNLMAENGVGTFEIKKGVLTVGSDWAMSMGGWGAGGCTQKWRNGPAGFQLIGLTVVDVSRACACGTTTDTNLVTGVEIQRTNRGEDGQPLEQEVVTKTKRKRTTIIWENFVYDKMCSSG
jgi:hypothetical protein